jgi:hypothetical protein
LGSLRSASSMSCGECRAAGAGRWVAARGASGGGRGGRCRQPLPPALRARGAGAGRAQGRCCGAEAEEERCRAAAAPHSEPRAGPPLAPHLVLKGVEQVVVPEAVGGQPLGQGSFVPSSGPAGDARDQLRGRGAARSALGIGGAGRRPPAGRAVPRGRDQTRNQARCAPRRAQPGAGGPGAGGGRGAVPGRGSAARAAAHPRHGALGEAVRSALHCAGRPERERAWGRRVRFARDDAPALWLTGPVVTPASTGASPATGAGQHAAGRGVARGFGEWGSRLALRPCQRPGRACRRVLGARALAPVAAGEGTGQARTLQQHASLGSQATLPSSPPPLYPSLYPSCTPLWLLWDPPCRPSGHRLPPRCRRRRSQPSPARPRARSHAPHTSRT